MTSTAVHTVTIDPSTATPVRAGTAHTVPPHPQWRLQGAEGRKGWSVAADSPDRIVVIVTGWDLSDAVELVSWVNAHQPGMLVDLSTDADPLRIVS